MWKIHLCLALCLVSVQCFFGIYPSYENLPVLGRNCGDTLFLTPFIKNGSIKEGQEAAKVLPLHNNVQSYSGFFTVNDEYNSNMFFWYFPSEKNPETAPVVVWLQGGPGSSSLYGQFNENGPFYLKKGVGVRVRKQYWSQEMNVIYIDNPVGTGFSFTDKDEGYVTNETQVGENLYSTILQFFQLFPHLRGNDFFITGESYAGKYVPAMAYTIHKCNPTADLKINLKGIAIGNGLCDPEHMLLYGDYLYQLGLVDSATRQQFKDMENKGRELIQQGRFADAFEVFDTLLDIRGVNPIKSLFYNATSFSTYYNYVHDSDYSPYGDMNKYLQKDGVRRTLHVGNRTFHTDDKVMRILVPDIMQTVRPWVRILIENYRVLIYNGQLDVVIAYPLTLNFIHYTQWNGKNEYNNAARKPWYVKDQLAGYSKSGKNFMEVLVRNAGHMVPMDQPVWALNLIKSFTYNQPLNDTPTFY